MCKLGNLFKEDLFIDSDSEDSLGSTGILDSIPDSTAIEQRLLDANLEMSNIRMITVTLQKTYASLSLGKQYQIMIDHIKDSLYSKTYYCGFELTKRGVLHAHMIADMGYEDEQKESEKSLRELGHICSKRVFDAFGALTYCKKQQVLPSIYA